MHLFLIRHGETEHNVAGLLAGVTDSKLTNHGVLQTQRLAKHLVNDRQLWFDQVFASDLQRAFMTANEIRKAQNSHENVVNEVQVVKLELLREQDFGSFELVSWSSRHDPNGSGSRIPKPTDTGFKPKETTDAMRQRAKCFVDDFIVPLFASGTDDGEVRIAVVSHGLFLGNLWKVILTYFTHDNVILDPGAGPGFGDRPLEFLPSWTNTGYLELSLHESKAAAQEYNNASQPTESVTRINSPFGNAKLTIHAVNCKEHLLNLKRTRGGVGSAAYDEKQRNIDTFFKKPKVEPETYRG